MDELKRKEVVSCFVLTCTPPFTQPAAGKGDGNNAGSKRGVSPKKQIRARSVVPAEESDEDGMEGSEKDSDVETDKGEHGRAASKRGGVRT